MPYGLLFAEKQPKPKVIIGVKVDGLKVEKLNEWSKNFRVGGFRKFLEDAVYFDNIQHPIVSAGNASDLTTIMSGTYPFYHSITGNSIYNRETANPQSAFFDKNESGIGTQNKISPHNILVTTMVDEIKLMNPQSTIHVVGIDAEAAIPMGGHSANSVTWIDEKNNRWATSTFYKNGLNRWADEMNISGVFKNFSYNELVKELGFTILNKELVSKNSGVHGLFLQFDLYANGNNKVKTTNELSRYIYLDNIIQEIVYAVNAKYGEENVLFFLMGGIDDSNSPEILSNNRISSGLFNADRALALLNTYLMAIYGQGQWVSGYYGKNIYLNRKLIEDRKLNIREMEDEVADFMGEFEGVHAAYTTSKLNDLSVARPDPRFKLKNSYYRKTTGEVQLLLKPGWLEVDNKQNVIDDSNSPIVKLPFFLMGLNFEPAVVKDAFNSIDIAPTLCDFLGVAQPNASLGELMIW